LWSLSDELIVLQATTADLLTATANTTPAGLLISLIQSQKHEV